MTSSPLRVRRIALLTTVAAALVGFSTTTAPAAHGSQRAAAPLTVSFLDSTGAPGALLRLPRNRLVVRRTAAGRLAVGRKRSRALGRARAPIRLSVRVDSAAGRLTVRAGRRRVTLRRHLRAERCAVPGGMHIAVPQLVRCPPLALPAGPGDVLATPDAPARATLSVLTATPTPTPVPTGTPTPTPTPTPAPPPLFAPSSVWRAPLPATPALDPAGLEIVGKLQATVAQNLVDRTGPWIETTGSSTPLYVVGPTQPGVRVTLDGGAWATSLQQALNAVPVPNNAVPASGPDKHLTVWQPSTDRLWELWHARKLTDGWHADFGGAIQGVSRDPGYYTTTSWPTLSQPWWGATATSLPVVAGTMLLSELRAGVIPHALSLNIPFARPKAYSWPAQRTDGTSTDLRGIPEGARFRIDPTVNISQLNLPPMTRMMALAVQKYGMVVRDQTAWAVGFHAEDPRQFGGTDPYYGSGGFFGGKYPIDLLQKFPWERLQLLKMDLRGG